MSTEPHAPSMTRILATLCTVMEVSPGDLLGKTTPRTKPRLVWARNMASFVLHDLGFSDGAIAGACDVHRVTVLVRRRRMAEKLESAQRYRELHGAILARLAGGQAGERPREGGSGSALIHGAGPLGAQPSP